MAPHYGMERVSYVMNPKGYRFESLRRVPFQRLNSDSSFLDNTALLTNPSVDLVHTMNMLPINGDRFVVSFELELPRYLDEYRAWQHRLGHRLLASARCRQILSISDVGARLMKEQFQQLGLPEIAQKISVFRGAVVPSLNSQSRRYRDHGPLRCLFVGGAGFRKGIMPVVEALETLRKGEIDVELTVISAIQLDEYVSGNAPPLASAVCEKLAALPWVTHHLSLSNRRVRRLMQEQDLLLLPSFDETLGWVVIEAGMEGLGVVTTDIFAFPELVQEGVTGRMLTLPKNKQSRWHGLTMTESAREKAWIEEGHQLATQLVAVLEDVAADRSLVSQWGQGNYDKMMRLYHPDMAAVQLSQIYSAALAS
ncbi:MAG: glycosyltransferase family 4 protein [Phormidesmis sp.]